MNSIDPVRFRILDLQLDVGRQTVSRDGTELHVPKLSFDLLLALARAAPNVLTVQALMEQVWPNQVVGVETVAQRVKLLRRALGDEADQPRYLVGERRRGYRLVAPVTELPDSRRTLTPTGLVESIGSANIPDPLAAHHGTPGGRADVTGMADATASFPARSATPPATPRPARRVPLGWIGGTLFVVIGLAAFWAIVHYSGLSRAAERTSAIASPVIHSLAVLPLDNLSGDKEQEYFADGMTDALITDLAQIGSLRVISRTSAIQFKGSKERLPQIGRELKVDAVVEGTVARAEGRVRITAQLVEASSDRHLWAKSYERDLKDVLVLQDEIARDITEQIRVNLTPKERSQLVQTRPVDAEAYDDYLRGTYWMDQPTLEGHNKACDYFQKAVAKDPSYALGFFGVAWCQDNPNKVRETLITALTLDPSLAEAHALLAKMKFDYDWDWAGAEAELKQAIALNPNSALAHSWYSFYLVAMARLDEATTEIERARDLDPYSAWVTFWLGQVLYHARRYDDALRVNQRGLEMHPDNDAYYWAIADIYEQKKSLAEAFTARQQALTLQKDPRVTALDAAYKHRGYEGYLLKQAEFEQTHNALYAVHCYALLNDEPRAIAALEAAYKQHDSHILFLRTAPEADAIRSSPRFQDLVRHVESQPPPGDKN